MSLDQTILFWNRAAERITEHTSASVIGRRCYDVLGGLTARGITPECLGGCPTLRALRAGQPPAAVQLRILSASGERKLVSVSSMVIGGMPEGEPMVAHLLTELPSDAQTDAPAPTGRGRLPSRNLRPAPTDPALRDLTNRELEVLRLVALGHNTPTIAVELGISPHTVLNHIRHFRRKLNAKTKLDAVMTAMRMGMLNVE